MSDRIKPIYVEYLKKYMRFYRELQSGKRTPQTPLQQNFVDFIRGKTQRAMTIHAKAFSTYLMNPSLYDKHLKDAPGAIRASKDRPSTHNDVSRVVHSPTPKRATPSFARFFPEPLGTGDDFRKDSAANRSNAFKNKL